MEKKKWLENYNWTPWSVHWIKCHVSKWEHVFYPIFLPYGVEIKNFKIVIKQENESMHHPNQSSVLSLGILQKTEEVQSVWDLQISILKFSKHCWLFWTTFCSLLFFYIFSPTSYSLQSSFALSANSEDTFSHSPQTWSTVTGALMLCSSLCRVWNRIPPGTSRQPASQLGAAFSLCLLLTQLAELQTPRAASPSGSGGGWGCCQPAPCLSCDYPSRTNAALLPKATLMVLLDLENCILPLLSFIPHLLSSTASKCMHWQPGWWMASAK